ncbi:MAG TPA: cytochrome P450 [Bryobacteraceae bacterium]|nr:cytochrome P450 [Bryobacteraceae bacterium]
MNLFADEIRRDPYPLYSRMRTDSPLLRVPPPFDAWLVFDYETVKWILSDHQVFSSRVRAPKWFTFFDPPEHTKLRNLISQAFHPRMAAELEPRIRALSRQLLDRNAVGGEMDLAADFSIPLAMQVIAGIIGIPLEEWAQYRQWSDVILRLSYTRSGGPEAELAMRDFNAVTLEMDAWLAPMIERRRGAAGDDLLTRLMKAEIDGETLSQKEILGFFQLLIVAGQETTANLINNAVLCFLEHPGQLARLLAEPGLLPGAIEEVLRYRSPLQWIMRTPGRDVEVHGRTIPAGGLVLPMMGSANRDPRQFPDADSFDIRRDPNPHVSFGHGIHFCLGAALSRLESKIALSDLLRRFQSFELASGQPWEPRQALNVHGPASLPIRFTLAREAAAPQPRPHAPPSR